MKLTDKQRRFADEYIANGGNATQAAAEAGYSRKTAYSIGAENLRKPQIADYIRERTEAIEEARVAKGDEVLKFLTSIMRGEEKAETVVVSKDWGATVEEYVDQKNRLKAAELLAKYHGLMTQSVNVAVEGITFVDDLPDDDDDG